MSVEDVSMRLARAVVSIIIEGDDEQPAYIGSGVLVRLAGHEFVLTAGHNTWDKKRNDLLQVSVSMPPKGIHITATPGDGSALRARVAQAAPGQDPEPDVAVIELSDLAALRDDREPFEEHEIAFLSPSAPSRLLVLAGFPNRLLGVGKHMDLGELGRPLPLGMRTLSLVVHSLEGRRHENEPAGGRGIHVGISARGTDNKRGGVACDLPEPYGMSGGPLVLPEGAGVLVGIARCRSDLEDGHDEWCEPVVEAVRALLWHEDEAVSTAARRIVERCDTEASAAGSK